MKLVSFILLTIFNLLATVYGQNPLTKEILYAGSFSERGSKGIYVFQFDRNDVKLINLQTVTEGEDPSFLAIDPSGKYLYAVYNQTAIKRDGKGSVVSFKINPSTGLLKKLNEQSSEGRGPCHISVDPKGRFIYVSNYGSGTLSVYPINSDGSLDTASDVIHHVGNGPHPNQKGPHVHSVIPSADGKFVYVCDLGVDKLFFYQVKNKGKLIPATVPFYKCAPGSGPRQFAISPDGKYAALVEELISGLVFFNRNLKTGELTPIQHFSMLPDSCSERGSDATVYFSPDNNFVYATNWGPLGITVYSIDKKVNQLKLVHKDSTFGTHPRDICIDKNGKYVFIANMGSDNLVVLKRNQITGNLSSIDREIRVPGISCIVQLIIDGKAKK